MAVPCHDIIQSGFALRQFFIDNGYNIRLDNFNLSHFLGNLLSNARRLLIIYLGISGC